MAKLERLITPGALKALAGATTFGRGEDYLADGAVERLRRSDEHVSARVIGSEPYQVELWADGDELGYGCSCPRAADGFFCKHCVAVGLALLDERIPNSQGGEPDKQRDPESLIRDFLLAQSPEVLTELIIEQTQRDDALHRSLLLMAERASGSPDILRSFRKAIDDATRVRGFVTWNEAGDLASDLDALVDSLEDLLTSSSAGALVELAEYAIEKVDQLLAEDVDDSGGEVGDVLARLGDLHLRTCQVSRPEPVALAERLFRYETTVSFGAYTDSVRSYQEVLGIEGIARFRSLAERQWEQIQPLGPSDPKHRSDFADRFQITHIMETLAQMSGDTDALVVVKSRDLSSPYQYLTIAEIYQKAGQDDMALDWAERGIKSFPDRPDNRLRDFLVTDISNAIAMMRPYNSPGSSLKNGRRWNITASYTMWPTDSVDGRGSDSAPSPGSRRWSSRRPTLSTDSGRNRCRPTGRCGWRSPCGRTISTPPGKSSNVETADVSCCCRWLENWKNLARPTP